MLSTYFKHVLVSLGYPDDLAIEFSLGYCQGDGVAFYGRLPLTSIEALMLRLMVGQEPMVRAVIHFLREIGRVDVSIERNSFGRHYSHWNTMALESDVDFTDAPADTVATWVALWEKFVDALKDDLQNTSKQLERDGYALLEATRENDSNTWVRTSANYTVTVSEVPAELDWFDAGDDDATVDTAKALIGGTHRLIGVRVVVADRLTGRVVGESVVHNVLAETRDKTLAGVRRDLLGEAVWEVRHAAAQAPRLCVA